MRTENFTFSNRTRVIKNLKMVGREKHIPFLFDQLEENGSLH